MPDKEAVPTQEQQAPATQPERDEATGKLVYIYQPLDSEGQPIGKPYRFLYTDHQDLINQLTRAKENGDRYIHEVKTGKRQVKGEPAIPEPQPAPESAEEADRKRREQFRQSYQEEFGVSVDEGRKRQRIAQDVIEHNVSTRWVLENEANGFYPCPQNAKAMLEYLDENKLARTAKNLDLAFEELRDSLVQHPKAPETKPADSTQQQAQGNGATQTVPATRSTGIIPGQFQGTRRTATPEKQPLTRERFRQINKMSYPEFKRLQRTNPAEADAFVKMKTAQPAQ